MRSSLALCIALVTFAVACAPAPEGTALLQTNRYVDQMVADGDSLFLVDEVIGDDYEAFASIVRYDRSTHNSTRLFTSTMGEAHPRKGLAVDGDFVYLLDYCRPYAATCSRLLRVPKSGGDATVLAQDRIVQVAAAGGVVYYTTSDENGLHSDALDGALWRLDASGDTAATALATGLGHLRDVIVTPAGLVTSEATGGLDASRKTKLVLRDLAGAPIRTLVEGSGAGGARPGTLRVDGDHLYFTDFQDVRRVPLAGGASELIVRVVFQIADLAAADGNLVIAQAGRYDGTTDDSQGTYVHGAIHELVDGALIPLARYQHEPTNPLILGPEVYWLVSGSAERDEGWLFRTLLQSR